MFILVLDLSTFIYFLLFKALFQELMPDLKADKDELIKRFEAVMCPFSTLRAARTAISQRNGTNLDSPTAIAMSTNAAVLALSKLIDQQSQCRAHSSYPGNDCEVLEQHLSPRCIHTSSADAVLSKTTQWTGLLSTSCDTQFPEPISFSTECGPTLSKVPDDQPDLTDSNDHNFSAAANVTPVMSSCHSSCSALSTSECSMSSVHSANFLCRANKTTSTSVESILPALNSYDYGLDKTSDVLGPCIDSSYLSNLVDSVGLATTQAVIHEAGLNHDILTCYRHFHVSTVFIYYTLGKLLSTVRILEQSSYNYLVLFILQVFLVFSSHISVHRVNL